MVTVKNLNFVNKKKKILNNISLHIEDGERVALVGSNGAGKTTTVEAIIGLNKKVTGEIKFNFDYDKSPLEKIGIQFQDSNFPSGMTVRDILDFFKEKTKNIDLKFYEKMIKVFNVEEFIDVDSSKISGGQGQKINILLALINRPRILFMDELTTGLDSHSKGELVNFVEKYINDNNVTVILVTHNPSEIDRFIDKVIVLEKGSLKETILTKDIKKKYGSTEEFLYSL